MKFERTIDRNYFYQYTCGNYRIAKTHDINIFTGREMSAGYQHYNIYKGNEKIGIAFTLKEAKNTVEKLIEKEEMAKEAEFKKAFDRYEKRIAAINAEYRRKADKTFTAEGIVELNECYEQAKNDAIKEFSEVWKKH